jgi:uncharacterized membrane protein
MPTTTDPRQRSTDSLRTDRLSGSSDSRTGSATLRSERQTGSLSREHFVSSRSGEYTTGRLRPVTAAAPHESVIPNKELSALSENAMRKLSPAEFSMTMAHFYRGEVQRSNTWRTRLDTTTYWAVLTAGGALSFAFSSPNNPHFLIPIISILVAIFLVMEARRYRYYEIWSSRVRVIETGYLAQMLAPDGVPRDQEWASHLAADLLTPHFTISVWEAIGRRLRRNYIWIFALLALSWNLKVYLHPAPAQNFEEFIQRASVGLAPGWIVFIVGFVFNVTIFVVAVGTLRLREATGEVLPRHEFSLRPLQRVTSWTRAAASSGSRATVRRAKRARQRMRGAATGEFKKIDITQTPDRKTGVRGQRSEVGKESLSDAQIL